MPILQERVIAIITAAQDYQRALKLTLRAINEAQERATGPAGNPADELKNLSFMFGSTATVLIEPGQSEATIAIEAAYFRRNAKRNESAKKLRRRKRHGDDSVVLPAIPPRSPFAGVESEEDKLIASMGQSPAKARAEARRRQIQAQLEEADRDADDNDIGPDVEIE